MMQAHNVLITIFFLTLAQCWLTQAALADQLFPSVSTLPSTSETVKLERILSVDEAFRFDSYQNADGVVLMWQVQPGYYLYRDKFSLTVGDKSVEISLPDGEWRNDEIFGEVQVFDGLVEVVVDIEIDPAVPTIVGFQGCAEKGYCYPPQKVSLNSSKNPLTSGK